MTNSIANYLHQIYDYVYLKLIHNFLICNMYNKQYQDNNLQTHNYPVNFKELT